MSRPRSASPSYRYHISGQAVVSLAGSDFYLGPYDSPESHARYHALLAEYNANGRQAPNVSRHQDSHRITVRCVTGEFRAAIVNRYGNNETHARNMRNLCTLLEDEYGNDPADEFGPRKLAALRDLFVASGNSRKYANSQTNSIRMIFKHAVSRELISVNTLIALKTLEPLRYGQTTARENKPRQPVKLEVVKATAAYLSPTLKAMVALQVSCGMRPGEVRTMKPSEIERRDDGVWMYRPQHHKNTHRGTDKAVPIVGDLKLILRPFLEDRELNDYCFSPKESAEWYRQQRRNKRVTPEQYGDAPGRKRQGLKGENAKRRPGSVYTKDSFRRAITRASEKAKVEAWTPYQLRHLTATEVTEALDLACAQALLGHSSAAMTRHYAKSTESQAIRAANVAPSIA